MAPSAPSSLLARESWERLADTRPFENTKFGSSNARSAVWCPFPRARRVTRGAKSVDHARRCQTARIPLPACGPGGAPTRYGFITRTEYARMMDQRLPARASI